jgi:hypothetical protein
MRDILIDFGVPALVLIVCAVLLLCGVDSEVKTAMILAIGVMLKAVYSPRTPTPPKIDALQSKSGGTGAIP